MPSIIDHGCATESPSPVRALLIVDVQTGHVTGPDGIPTGPALLAGVSGLLAAARAASALGKRVVVPPQGHATQPIPPSAWFARGIDAPAAARAAELALSVYCEIDPDVTFAASPARG